LSALELSYAPLTAAEALVLSVEDDLLEQDDDAAAIAIIDKSEINFFMYNLR
jgi:S-adenosylmethionine synthetase